MTKPKIYAYSKVGSKNWIDFLTSLEEQFNNNPSIISAAQNCNMKFYQKITEITSDINNSAVIGSLINDIIETHTQYYHINNVKYKQDDTETRYNVTINLLSLQFDISQA